VSNEIESDSAMNRGRGSTTISPRRNTISNGSSTGTGTSNGTNSSNEQQQQAQVATRKESESEYVQAQIVASLFGAAIGRVKADFACAIEKKILFHGRMYVTESNVCFYSNLFGYENRIKIPLSDIVVVTKLKTIGLIADAICIQVSSQKEYIFRSFFDRDECYNILSDLHNSIAIKGRGNGSNGDQNSSNSSNNDELSSDGGGASTGKSYSPHQNSPAATLTTPRKDGIESSSSTSSSSSSTQQQQQRKSTPQHHQHQHQHRDQLSSSSSSSLSSTVSSPPIEQTMSRDDEIDATNEGEGGGEKPPADLEEAWKKSKSEGSGFKNVGIEQFTLNCSLETARETFWANDATEGFEKVSMYPI
jgi:hypothetical protein